MAAQVDELRLRCGRISIADALRVDRYIQGQSDDALECIDTALYLFGVDHVVEALEATYCDDQGIHYEGLHEGQDVF